MSGLGYALVALAAVAVIVIRQIRPKRLSGRRWWLVPAVLMVLVVRDAGTHGLIDHRHAFTSGLLLAAELVVGLLMGVAWGWTSRIWTEPDGSVWVRGTRATAAVWIGAIVLRVGIVGLGALIGVRVGTDTMILALAVSLLVRSGILTWRAQSVGAAQGRAVAGGSARPASWRDRV